MNSRTSDLTVAELFTAASSTAFTPGGGCVTAICGHLGIALLLKAIRISNKRQSSSFLEIHEAELSNLAASLADLADADSQSFHAYMDALRLPKVTESDKIERAKQLRAAAMSAIQVSLDILKIAELSLKIAQQTKHHVVPNIIADVIGGIELIGAMQVVALENGRANLAGLAGDDDAIGGHLELAGQTSSMALTSARQIERE